MDARVSKPEVVVVTGASSGVSRATVRKFGKHDAHIGLRAMPQLPGLNTPQFGHCLQPVPPIYQTEVAAKRIYYAAHHKLRELYVGASTVFPILGTKVALWFVDWYLGRTGGYSSQQTQKPVEDSYQPDNLFEPVAKDPGAHGRFDELSHDESPQLWAIENRGASGRSRASPRGPGCGRTEEVTIPD